MSNKKRYINIGLCLVLSASIFAVSVIYEDDIFKSIKKSKLVVVEDVQDNNEDLLNNEETSKQEEKVEEKNEAEKIPTSEEIIKKYNGKTPTKWSEKVEGVTNIINTKDKTIYLTFDACGGSEGNGYDKELIDYLIKEKIPATLFVNYRWIEANKDTFNKLAKNDLFEIENHGYSHKPLSVNGKSAYNIKGTASVEEVYNEIELNSNKIKELTGERPKFFRAGTAYYDEVAVSIAKDLGQTIAGFTIAGDEGAKLTKDQIVKKCASPKNGSILLFHMNQPKQQTYEGIKELLPKLKSQGYKFGKLEDTLKK